MNNIKEILLDKHESFFYFSDFLTASNDTGPWKHFPKFLKYLA